MVTEYVDGKELWQHIQESGGELEESEARSLFQQLIIAVDFLHQNKKGHRDIKPANVRQPARCS
jgi:serine/threonine protein kinase